MAQQPKPAARRSGCPIGISLDIFGDRWSLLIVRDLLFKERRSFQAFAASGEGIASNVLADRLHRLLHAGIIESGSDLRDGRRTVYRLTEKGLALAPMLVEMVIWAARYEDTDAPSSLIREMERDRRGFVLELRKSWKKQQRSSSS